MSTFFLLCLKREKTEAIWKLTIDSIDILLQNHPIPLPLHLRHAHIDVDLLLGKERMLDVGLDSSEQEWSKDFVELLDDRVLVVLASSHAEPGVEVLAGK